MSEKRFPQNSVTSAHFSHKKILCTLLHYFFFFLVQNLTKIKNNLINRNNADITYCPQTRINPQQDVILFSFKNSIYWLSLIHIPLRSAQCDNSKKLILNFLVVNFCYLRKFETFFGGGKTCLLSVKCYMSEKNSPLQRN